MIRFIFYKEQDYFKKENVLKGDKREEKKSVES